MPIVPRESARWRSDEKMMRVMVDDGGCGGGDIGDGRWRVWDEGFNG